MDQTHIHLIFNHLPVVGSILGAFVLLFGMFTNTEQTKNAAYFVFIICAIGALITNFTGEAAEEAVEHLQGVSHDTIHEHEESALVALITLVLAGLASIAALYFSMKKSALAQKLSYVVLILALVGFGLVARTAYLGGMIRHTELNGVESGERKVESGE